MFPVVAFGIRRMLNNIHNKYLGNTVNCYGHVANRITGSARFRIVEFNEFSVKQFKIQCVQLGIISSHSQVCLKHYTKEMGSQVTRVFSEGSQNILQNIVANILIPVTDFGKKINLIRTTVSIISNVLQEGLWSLKVRYRVII